MNPLTRGLLTLALAAPLPEEPEAVVFFSPDAPDASALFRSFGDVPVRAVLLVEDYATGREPSEAFLANVDWQCAQARLP